MKTRDVLRLLCLVILAATTCACAPLSAQAPIPKVEVRAACGWVLWVKQAKLFDSNPVNDAWSASDGYETGSDCQAAATRRQDEIRDAQRDSLRQGRLDPLTTFHCFSSDFDPRPRQ